MNFRQLQRSPDVLGPPREEAPARWARPGRQGRHTVRLGDDHRRPDEGQSLRDVKICPSSDLEVKGRDGPGEGRGVVIKR